MYETLHVPWKPTPDDWRSAPPHPVTDFDLRVGVLTDPARGAEPLGYVLVDAGAGLEQVAGRLWWRKWGNAQ